jgi:hypothetical protein
LIIAVEKVIALYPYNATNSDELTFQKHDVIAVIDREDIDWWEGELSPRENNPYQVNNSGCLHPLKAIIV